MTCLSRIRLTVLLLLSVAVAVGPAGTPSRASALPAADLDCAAVMLTLRPGLNPAPGRVPFRIAPDIPRGLFTVALPVYPGATPLTPFVASPFPMYPADPYLQTAGAEYQTSDGSRKVEAWFAQTLPACGWRRETGSWSGNASVFNSGVTFVSGRNRDWTVDVSFGDAPSGGTYIGYGVEAITLPPRPAASYLHGPFAEVWIALRRGVVERGQPVWHVVHTTLHARSAIHGLVGAINDIKGYRTVLPVCSGGLSLTGPAWLSFVRRDGSVVHAFEGGSGACGGLAVNGIRWLTDDGAVWKRILSSTS